MFLIRSVQQRADIATFSRFHMRRQMDYSTPVWQRNYSEWPQHSLRWGHFILGPTSTSRRLLPRAPFLPSQTAA
jgi:hypothetical protein